MAPCQKKPRRWGVTSFNILLGMVALTAVALIVYGSGHTTGYRFRNGSEVRLISAHVIALMPDSPEDAARVAEEPRGWYRNRYRSSGGFWFLFGPSTPGWTTIAIPLWTLCLFPALLWWIGRHWTAAQARQHT